MLSKIFSCMKTEIFWSALSTIATFVAVVVALWQTKYSFKKKLKLSFSDNCFTMDNSERVDLIQFTIANVGNKKITISQLQIVIPTSYNIAFIPALMKYTAISFPCALEPEEAALIQMQKSDFISNLQEVLEKDTEAGNKHLIMQVTDSVGKRYALRLKRTPLDYAKGR